MKNKKFKGVGKSPIEVLTEGLPEAQEEKKKAAEEKEEKEKELLAIAAEEEKKKKTKKKSKKEGVLNLSTSLLKEKLKPEKKTKSIQILVKPSTDLKLKQIAKEYNSSVSSLLNTLIEEFIQEEYNQ